MTYSLSADLFRKIDYNVFTDILFAFSNCQLPDIKVAVDSNRAILQRYMNNTPEEFKNLLYNWTDLITKFLDTSISIVEIDLSSVPNEEYCLMVASSINGERALIVNSKQNFPFKLKGQEVEYQGEKIIVYEKEEAKQNIYLRVRGNKTTNVTNNYVNVNNSNGLNINNNSNNG